MILVVGSTGLLGRMIVEALLADGRDVKALVRSPAAHRALSAAGAATVTGDLTDVDSLCAACSDVSAVITTANSSARGGADTVDSVDLQGNRDLVDVAASTGIGRFLFISSLGADPDHPMPFLRAKGQTEQHLAGSGMPWTVVQPNLYMDTLPMAVVGEPAIAGRPVVLVGAGRRRHSMVAARDVAGYAVASLDDDYAAGQTLQIGGPEPVSWHDVVDAFQHELDRTLEVHHVPAHQPAPHMPELVFQLLAGLDSYDSPLDTSPLASRYHVTPTTLGQFVHEYVAHAHEDLA